MKILILFGHPNPDTFCGALADAYEKGALDAGHEVQRINVGELDFEPNLKKGYKEIQTLETDLLRAQEDILWCDHLVVVYPTWWVTMPSILKGFFDRVFIPGFAFQYRDGSPWWDQLLKGRSSRIITTMDAPKLYYWLVYFGAGQRLLKYGILRFCGFSPVRSTTIGSVKNLDEGSLLKWIERLKILGKRGR